MPIGSVTSSPVQTSKTQEPKKTAAAPAPQARATNTDSVSLSSEAQQATAPAPAAKPPEEKGVFRKIFDFFMDGENAKMKQNAQQEAFKMGLDPNRVQDNLSLGPAQK